ncbi:hypothetical protein CGCTS75_v014787 [Colletotrichum tropicale]|nr:hypothetical protein CGCTS75_v014787 [Colletotrichum tropicale]
MDSEPNFTWVHLPATIMPWMEHLVQRIMRDENHATSNFNQAMSFFKNSWTEIPDKVSASRMMRPRFVSRNIEANRLQEPNTRTMSSMDNEDEYEEEKEYKNGGKRDVANEFAKQDQMEIQDEQEMAPPSLTASAIYMPYFAYAFQCGDEADDDNKADDKAKLSVPQIQTGKKQAENEKTTTENPAATEYGTDGLEDKKWKHAENIRESRNVYEGLMKGYSNKIIHGSSTLDESYYHFGDDRYSIRDKKKRNRSQVVTKSWNKAQRQINQKREDQEEEDEEQQHQSLGPYWLLERNEAYLFDHFSDLRKGLTHRSPKSWNESKKSTEAIPLDDQLAKATSKAEKLSRSVRDILDELSMLQATIQYQEDVQMAMRREAIRLLSCVGTESILETNITSTHNINDIKRLTIIAERILATIDTTLSLHQSEIANLQARLAMQEGRALMVFTVVTTLFLPMSFLTSLFALDVASFQQAPPWAIVVIFLASVAFFIPMVIFAFSWERCKWFVFDLGSNSLEYLAIKPFVGAITGAMAFIRYLLELSQSSRPTQDDNRESKSHLDGTGVSLQQTGQRRASAAGALRARKPPRTIGDNNAKDLEKGLGEGSD